MTYPITCPICGSSVYNRLSRFKRDYEMVDQCICENGHHFLIHTQGVNDGCGFFAVHLTILPNDKKAEL